MTQQERIFLAAALCIAILLGWQAMLPTPAPIDTPDNSPVVAQTEPVLPETAPEGAGAAPTAVAPRVQSSIKQAEHVFETPLLRGAVRNGDVGLTKLTLTNFEERASSAAAGEKVSLVAPDTEHLQARLEWHTPGEPSVAMDFIDDKSLHLQGTGASGLRYDVELSPRQDAYAIDYTLRITNATGQSHQAGASIILALVSKGSQDKREPGFFAKLFGMGQPPIYDAPRASEEVTAVCDLAGSLKRKSFTEVVAKPWFASDKARWAALDQQYFALAVMPQGEVMGACGVRLRNDTLSSSYVFPNATIAANGVWEQKFSLYAGPKRDAQLSQVNPALQEVIDYNLLKVPLGFLARPMVWLLNLLHDNTGSWGLAIMLLTVTVKLILFPVTYKSLTSARRMQALKPEIDALKIRFADDKERQGLEQMKLFKEKGVNPVGGCLPMLLQMPVWITLYRTLWSDVDLYQQSFLWLNDLTAREPFPSLAIAVGALTILQQKVTPMAMDNQQAKVMTYVMPVMLTGFMVALPSGLVLYILVNSILTILQQLAINKRSASV